MRRPLLPGPLAGQSGMIRAYWGLELGTWCVIIGTSLALAGWRWPIIGRVLPKAFAALLAALILVAAAAIAWLAAAHLLVRRRHHAALAALPGPDAGPVLRGLAESVSPRLRAPLLDELEARLGRFEARALLAKHLNPAAHAGLLEELGRRVRDEQSRSGF